MSGSREPERGPVLVSVLAGMLGLAFFLVSGQDDCYITYGAARALATTGRVVNYNGAALEQSSSLLHTLLLAGLHRLTGVGLPLLGWGLGIAAGVLVTLRSARLCSLLGLRHGLTTVALVATWPYLLYWWFGGLETTLAAWLLVELLLVAGERRRSGGSAIPRLIIVVLAWVAVRPEAGLVAGAAVLADALLSKESRRPALTEAAVIAAALGLACWFRLASFGALFPQPVVAKAGGSLIVKGIVGLIYWVETLHVPFGLLVALPLLALPWLLLRPEDGVERLTLLVLGAEAGFVTLSGGDWMAGGRFVAVLAAPTIVVGVRLLERSTWVMAPGRVLAGCLALNLLGVVVFSLQSGTGRSLPGYLAARHRLAAAATAEPFSFVELANRVHLRDAVFLSRVYDVIDRLLVANERITVLSDQAGMIMFYVAARYGSRVELVDRYGLTTAHFTERAAELGLLPGLAGLRWGYEGFFSLGASRPDPCWHPDVIFDIGAIKLRQIRSAGYLPVWTQTGDDGRWTVITQFVAVAPRNAAAFPGPARELLWEDLVGAGERQAR